MDLVGVGLGILIVIGYLGAIVYAISQMVRSGELNETERWAWIAALILFPVAAAIVWFAAGPHPFGLRLSRGIR